jgi:hypothetical protein
MVNFPDRSRIETSSTLRVLRLKLIKTPILLWPNHEKCDPEIIAYLREVSRPFGMSGCGGAERV